MKESEYKNVESKLAEYKAQKGDTLWAIASKLLRQEHNDAKPTARQIVDEVNKIAHANNMRDKNKLKVGETIVLPSLAIDHGSTNDMQSSATNVKDSGKTDGTADAKGEVKADATADGKTENKKEGKENEQKNDAATKGNAPTDNQQQHEISENSESQAAQQQIQAIPKKGFNGVLSSPDNKSTYVLTENRLYDSTGNLLGTIDGAGKIKLSKDGSTEALNSFRPGWKFEGQEDGKYRSFELRQNICNGKIFVPDQSGKPVAHDVRMGVVIDKNTGEQLGTIIPPTENRNGMLSNGEIINSLSKQRIPFDAINGLVFDLKTLGDAGVEGSHLQGICLHESNSNGKIFNARRAVELQDRLASRVNDKIQSMNVGFHPIDWISGNSDATLKMYQSELGSSAANKASLQKILQTGEIDPSKLNSLIAITESLNPPAAQNAEINKQASDTKSEAISDLVAPAKLEIPRISSSNVTEINGRLRVNADVFVIKDGRLYRTCSNAGNCTEESEPCGALLPGYGMMLNGQNPVDLSQQARVLMEFSIGSSEKHQLIGLGAPRHTDCIGFSDGGLVDVQDLFREAKQAKALADNSLKDYVDNKTWATGWITDPIIGHRQEMLRGFSHDVSLQTNALEKSSSELFNKGFDPSIVSNFRLDNYTKSTQLLMHGIGATAASSSELSVEAKQSQKIANDAIVMTAITVATAGIGASLNAAVSAGKIGVYSGYAAEIGASTLAGGSISMFGRMSNNSNDFNNFKAGMWEGAAMASASVGARMFGQFNQLNNMRTALNTAQAARSLEQQAILNCALGRMVQSGRSTVEIAAVFGAYKLASAGVQSYAFAKSAALREPGAEALTAKTLALSTAFFLAGELGRYSVSRATGCFGLSSKSFANAALSDMGMAYSNASSAALTQAIECEKMRIAKDLGKEPSQLSMQELSDNIDYAKVADQMNQSGAIAVVSAPFMTALSHQMVHMADRRFNKTQSLPQLLLTGHVPEEMPNVSPELDSHQFLPGDKVHVNGNEKIVVALDETDSNRILIRHNADSDRPIDQKQVTEGELLTQFGKMQVGTLTVHYSLNEPGGKVWVEERRIGDNKINLLERPDLQVVDKDHVIPLLVQSPNKTVLLDLGLPNKDLNQFEKTAPQDKSEVPGVMMAKKLPSRQAINQSNEYARNHEFSGKLKDGFANAGQHKFVNRKGEFNSRTRPATVVDRANDPVLRFVIEEARTKFGDLAPKERAEALTKYAKELLTPESMRNNNEKPLDNWYSMFNHEQRGNRVLLGEFIRQGKGVCSQQALLLKVLCDELDLPATLVRGNGGGGRDNLNHAWTLIDIGAGPRVYDPRQRIYGADPASVHRQGKEIVRLLGQPSPTPADLNLGTGQRINYQDTSGWKVESIDENTGKIVILHDAIKCLSPELFEKYNQCKAQQAKPGDYFNILRSDNTVESAWCFDGFNQDGSMCFSKVDAVREEVTAADLITSGV